MFDLNYYPQKETMLASPMEQANAGIRIGTDPKQLWTLEDIDQMSLGQPLDSKAIKWSLKVRVSPPARMREMFGGTLAYLKLDLETENLYS